MSDHELPRDLVWSGAHASELALTSIADGQESIVGKEVLTHVDGCERCAGKLGRVALLSAAVGEGIARSRAPRLAVRRTPRPWGALAAGVSVSLLAAVPLVGQLGQYSGLAMAFFSRGVPALARGGLTLATSDAVSGALPAATLAASALLVMMGLAIARTRSRSVEGSAS